MAPRLKARFIDADPPVAPAFDAASVTIDDGYAIGTLVKFVPYTNTPSPTPTPSIASGNTGTAFSVEATTGGFNVRVAAVLNNAVTAAYTLGLEATNSAGTASANLSVTVNAAGAATLITSITLVNTTGVEIPTGAVTPSFGLPFAKAALPTAEYPTFKLEDGTVVPYSYKNRTDWADSSWKFSAFMLRTPAAIPASGSLVVRVYDGGSAPGTNSRTIADLSAGSTDLKIEAVGIQNLSGTWTAELNQGVTDNDMVTDQGWVGTVVEEWRIGQGFMQAAADHGQLESTWYAQALENSAGALYGIRVMPRAGQPWVDIDSPAKLKRGLTASLKNGASTIRDLDPNSSGAKTFTASGSTITCTAHGFTKGEAFRLTTTGTLPAGLSTGTTYYIGNVTTNTFRFYSQASSSISGSGSITTTDAGSGTHTMTPHIECVHFSSFFACGADGKPEFIANGSAAADAAIRITFDKDYLSTTKVYPAWDSVTGVSSSSSYDYRPYSMGPVDPYYSSGPEAHVSNLWSAIHFQTQAAVDERVVRVVGLTQGHLSTGMRRQGTLQPPVINNGSDGAGATYTGLGTTNPTFRYNSSSASGLTGPADDRSGVVVWDNAHNQELCAYAYLITGESYYLDLLQEAAVAQLANIATTTRNKTVGATTYYGVRFFSTSMPRVDAWPGRQLGLAAAMTPASALKDYLTDMLTDGYQCLNAYNAAQSAVWQNNGFYHFRTDSGDADNFKVWSFDHLVLADSYVVSLNENSDGLTTLNHYAKWYAMVQSTVGMWHGPAYSVRMRDGSSSSDAVVSDLGDIFFQGMSGSTLSYDGTADTITFSSFSTSTPTALTNGDEFMWYSGEGPSAAPTGLSKYTRYYAVNVSGLTCQLSLTLGGAAVDITGTGTLSQGAGLRLQTPPVPSDGKNTAGNNVYMIKQYAAIRALKAAGATGIDAASTDITSMVTGSGLTFASDPRNAMKTSYA